MWDIPEKTYKKMFEQVVELLEIEDILSTFARELSLGQKMKADLALMLLHEPELILLDEPTIGLDVLSKKQMIEFLKKLNRENGTTILVTSHDMDDLEQMAQRILLITKGKIAFDGSFDELRKNTGNICRIIIDAKRETPPVLKGASFVASENSRFEYEFDAGKLPISDILAQAGAIDNINDIEIKKASIEDVISELYIKWKK